jgi:hypothetical protein
MKKIHCSFLIALLIALAACASGAGSNRRVTGSTTELASMLTGQYQAEGTGLRLDIGSIGSTTLGEGTNLFATITGTLDGQNVREAAVLNLVNDAGDIRVTIVPEFDPTASPLAPGGIETSQLELNSACTVYMEPVRQGYEGSTRGTGTCVRAIQGAVGEWAIQVQPDSIRLTNLRNREQTLVFRETGDRAGR